ncbi:MAG: transketolase C-terminal domain-containing protein [Anaerolineales bacterium]
MPCSRTKDRSICAQDDKVPVVYEDGAEFEIGKANELRAGNDLTIIACGLMVAAALETADKLNNDGIHARVLDMHTLKPPGYGGHRKGHERDQIRLELGSYDISKRHKQSGSACDHVGGRPAGLSLNSRSTPIIAPNSIARITSHRMVSSVL